MTGALIAATVLIVLGLFAGEASQRAFRRRLADAGRSRMPAAPARARLRA
jgi:hypothetical protein